MQAVAQLVVGDARVPNGSAFAISANAALTARHCVYDGETPLAPLHLVFPGGGDALAASLLDADEAGDVALLALEQPLRKGWEPVALLDAAACAPQTPFLVRGYPAQRPFEDADRLDGHIVDTAATAFGGVPVIALFSPQVAAPVPRDPHGFSGAPVVVRPGHDRAELAVGLVRWGEVDPTTGLVRAGSVLAAPLAPLSERWVQVASAMASAPARAPAAAPLPGAGAIRSFEVQYLGRPGRPVPFGGRRRELAQIDRWVRAQDRPWLLLVASAGTGKSALLVRWRERARVASVYVPISLRYDLAREVQVLRAVAARLAAAHGEPAPEGDADALRDAVAELLSRPAPERLVVVLDGLDETEGWEAGPALLGGDLGEGVGLIVAARATASRPDAAAWIRALGWDARDTETLTLDRLDDAGVADVIAGAGEPVERLAGDPAAIDRLMRLTEGDPLVLAQLVSGLQRLRADELDAAIADLPSEGMGLREVFDSWWDGQRRLWAARGDETGRPVWSTLDVLACARGPLRRDELVSITGLDPEVLEDALRSLERFVVQGTDGGFALAHPRLADHRRRRLAEAGKLGESRRALLGWCESELRAVLRGERRRPSPYAVRHLGAHLVDAGAGAEEVMALVHPAWQAAWEDAVDDFDGYARDVARAQAAAQREAAARVAAGGTSWAAAAAVHSAVVAAGLADATALLSGELAVEVVRHGVWSERRAFEAVLALEKVGSVVRGLRALAPVLSREHLVAACDRVAAIDATGWRTTHGEAMGALAARRAELDGARDAVATVAGMPSGTGRAVALLELLRLHPGAADGGALSPLIQELADIGAGRTTIDVTDVLERVADSVGAALVAAALAGRHASAKVAIDFMRACIRRVPPSELPDHLSDDELGFLAPWLAPEDRDNALTRHVEDVDGLRLRDAQGDLVAWRLGDDADLVAIMTARGLAPVARRLPPALAARAAEIAAGRLTGNFAVNRQLAPVIVTLAERLPDDHRERVIAPVLAQLDRLASRGGNMREVADIAAGLGRCGHAADVFTAAAADGDRSETWHEALVHAAPYLPRASIAGALTLASGLPELYRPWVAGPVLARLAGFGPSEAAEAVRLAATPAGGREHAAAEALRTADRVIPAPCEPPDPEPAPDPITRARVLQLLAPDRDAPQHDHDAILAVRGSMNALDVAGAAAVARAVEGISGVSSRNHLRGPVATRLARLGALDAALEVPLDPYVASGPLRDILRFTPEDRLDAWLAYVQRRFGGNIHADARAELMMAAAGRIAGCAPPRAWALLDAWLQRPATRLERLCDLVGYAPAVRATAGADATRSLADWLAPADARTSDTQVDRGPKTELQR